MTAGPIPESLRAEAPDPQSGHQDSCLSAEAEVARRLTEARGRLEHRAHLDTPPPDHYHRELERPFTAEERDRVTILIGGLTARHEQLIQAILAACGHRCLPLPQMDLAACLIGKQYGNNGLCNPAYFTVGALVSYLQQLEAQGLTRREVVDHYVFFTATTCGPCRFGMYEGEFRLALRNAGFEGFRVLTFQQDDGVRAKTGEAGLKLSLLLGLGAWNAIQFGDALNDFAYAVRPFEAVPGSTNRALAEAMALLSEDFSRRTHLDPGTRLPDSLWKRLKRRKVTRQTTEVLMNLRRHIYGQLSRDVMRACRQRLAKIQVDRLRVKPIVKITGEFWAQTTEGDGNFKMYEFLEREGAQVIVDPLGTWLMYLVRQGRADLLNRRGVEVPRGGPLGARFRAWRRDETKTALRRLAFWAGAAIYRQRYHTLCRALGDVPHPLIDQEALAEAAEPFYKSLARGGEGHLEVGKNVYYSTRRAAHMVLSLKPFGCMPSTQSDGVQSTVAARVNNVLFLPIETAAEGELHAHSRVQMVLVEARERAEEEFERALSSTGKKLSEIRRYVADHATLRSPFYHVPSSPGVAGVAANFVLHVSHLIDSDRAWRSRSVVSQSGLRAAANQQVP